MDLDELRLQRGGYTAALRDGEIQRVMLSGRHKRIAVTYFEWAGVSAQIVLAPWTVLDSAASINALADKLDTAVISRAQRTSISGALDFASRLLDQSPVQAARRVIDVSGDGPNNQGRVVTAARDALIDKGIVVNGLPIVLKRGNPIFDLAALDHYYEDCVIGGPGAFMIAIRDQAEFAPAIRRKLLLEIAGLTPRAAFMRVQQVTPEPRIDCTIGEQLWRRYMDNRDSP